MNIIICEDCREENEYGIKQCKNCGHELYYVDESINTEDLINEGDYIELEDNSINVNISIDEAIKKIEFANIGFSFTIDKKKIVSFSKEKKCVVLVGQKYFYRVENYVSATIVLNNFGKYTNIDVITNGGSNNFLGLNFGAENKLKEQIENIFEDYIIKN